jgi:tetratricopeptide (TPR) repeat protein
MIFTVLGRFTDAFRVTEALLPELEAGQHWGALATALMNLSIASDASRLGDALALLERAIDAARAASDPLLEADALGVRGMHLFLVGRSAEAVRSFDRAAALVAGDEARSDIAASGQALAAVLSGDFERAGALARKAKAAGWPGQSADPSSAMARNALLLANAAAGHPETGEQLRQVIDLQCRQRAPLADADLLAALGGVACLAGDFERAASLLGAARSAFGVHGSWRTHAGAVMYLHFGEEVRRALPPDVAKRARDAGRAMSVEEAFEHALGMLPPR